MGLSRDPLPGPPSPDRGTRRSRGSSFPARPQELWRIPVTLLLGILGVSIAVNQLPMSIFNEEPVGAPRPKSAAVPADPTATPRPVERLVPIPTAEPPAPQLPSAMPQVVNRGTPPVRKPRTQDPDPSSDRFVVVDGDSGAILFQRNAFMPVAPASLTKIMTAVLSIEHGKPSELVHVDIDAGAFPDSCVMGLSWNTKVSMQDLLYGLMLASGNDAAMAIGRHVGGSDAGFVQKMNEKAAWLGLGATHFANPHGFDAEDHYSCPYDMVALARYAMQYPEFQRVVATRSHDVREQYRSYTLRNVNGILDAYPGADGVKTGDTPQAGKSLVATAERDGRRVYVAFMQSTAGAVPDGALLLDWAFNSFTWR